METVARHMGRRPRGIWLPECAFRPGIDRVLADEGIGYFITDAHGLLNGFPVPEAGVHAPVRCPSGVAAFGRDLESSKQVWSSEQGYPGDGAYREFYRDLGYDGAYDYVEPYLHDDGIRRNLGLKYFRVTGRVALHEKQLYDRSLAVQKAQEHGGHFVFCRQHQLRFLKTRLKAAPVVLAPYDAELFGHWWYEGPDWIEFLCRKIYFDQKNISLITPTEYLKRHPRNQVSTPSMSSWGYKGYHEVWLEGSNDWIYRHLYLAANRMVELAQQNHDNADPLKRRALNQAARELMLAQSSDWAFIMKGGTVVEYAVQRTRTHLLRFMKLYRQIKHDRIDEWFLAEIEGKDNLFPDMDYRCYA
jgi:1,4-alpha-glucan branching enzyme